VRDRAGGPAVIIAAAPAQAGALPAAALPAAGGQVDADAHGGDGDRTDG